MGSVHRAPRTGRWEARWRDPAGRQRTKTFSTKADARAHLAELEVAMRRGAYVDPAAGKVTFGEYAPSWLATKAGCSPRTLANIEGRLENYVLPEFSTAQLARIQPSDVRAFVASLTAKGLAPSTVKGVYLVLAQVLHTAAVDNLIARSPCIDIELPRDRHHEEAHYLTAAQVDALAGAIDGRYRALVYLAAYGGLRAGELVALRCARVNPLAGSLVVAEAASEVRGGLTFGPTKTGRVRTIALPRSLAELLGAHMVEYPSSAGLVFTAAEGGAIRWRNFYGRHFRSAVTRAGLPEQLRFHDLRHTCAALLIANGRHMEEVKAHLGHSSIRVTSDRYGHLFPQAREALAAGLEETFQRAAEERAAAAGCAGVVQHLDERRPARPSEGRNTL